MFPRAWILIPLVLLLALGIFASAQQAPPLTPFTAPTVPLSFPTVIPTVVPTLPPFPSPVAAAAPTAVPSVGTGPPPRYVFQATLKPVNPSTPIQGISAVAGIAQFVLQGPSAGTYLTVTGLQPNVTQMMFVRSGTCPGPRADTNGDGYIDVVESTGGAAVTRFPLDLGNQISSNPPGVIPPFSAFPASNISGGLTYIRSDSIALWSNTFSVPLTGSPAPLPVPAITPIPPYPPPALPLGQTVYVPLSQLVVEILGIAPNNSLPASVQSLPGYPNTATFPVACGPIQNT